MNMKTRRYVFAALVVAAVSSYVIFAQPPSAPQQQQPPQPMRFFVTSVGLGNGANLGGLAGADVLVAPNGADLHGDMSRSIWRHRCAVPAARGT